MKPIPPASSLKRRKKPVLPSAPPRPRTPRSHKPAGMSLEEWQIALRREFGVAQNFALENIGGEPVFSEFMVTNPASGGRYRVAIRGEKPGENYCSCPDFSVNTLGTCKHLEFTLARLRQKSGAAAALARGHRTAYSSVFLRYGRRREVVFKPGTECPAALRRLAADYFGPGGALKEECFSRFDVFLKQAGGNGHELRCYEDAIQYVARVRDQTKLKEAVDRAFPGGAESKAFSRLLKVPLYPYQRQGAWFVARAGRAILADDMGLGKTIQAIAACEILAAQRGIQRVLVICPTSLKHQWKDEIQKFSGREAVAVEGFLPARTRLYESSGFYKIANYDVVFRDQELIRQWSPDLIILDEAQRIKNWKTRTAQSVKKLESPFAIVLTGTPLENRLEELHSIVEFVDRFHLGPRFRFLDEHQLTDEAGKVVGYHNLTRIAQTLSPILLRRGKGEVLKELPERLEKRFFVTMTAPQMQLHEENRETVARIAAKWRRYHYLSDTDQRLLMIALQNMRMSCNSTYLLDPKTDFGMKADEFITLIEEIFEEPEAKAVVFSQWVGTHELLRRRLAGRPWKHVFFHGQVPGPKRKDLIRQFREDDRCRLFLSTDAGGVGLNLQTASVVVNMDLPWNPAVLEQRIGRVHRLGQHRPVRVINFIASGTIEHGMLSLLSFKKSLFAGILEGGQDEVFLGGSRLTKFMESVEKVADSIPAAPPPQESPLTDKEEAAAGPEPNRHEAPPAAKPRPAEQAWAEVAGAGLAFLEKLGEALKPAPAGGEGSAATALPALAANLIEYDPAGRAYFKLPVPQPETLRKVADLLYQLTGNKR